MPDAIAAIANLLRLHPEIFEIDVNPPIVYRASPALLTLVVLILLEQTDEMLRGDGETQH